VSACWPIADLPSDVESKRVPPKNGLQADAPRAARAGSRTLGITMTDAQALAALEAAFAAARKPDHFTDYEHCSECKDHDDVLRSRTRSTIQLSDVDNPGRNPINFLTPEGFCYYLPALARLALSQEGEAFLVDLVPFHLCDTLYDKKAHRYHPWLTVLNDEQRQAILQFVRHVASTRRGIMDPNGAYAEELDRAVAFWEAECKAPHTLA